MWESAVEPRFRCCGLPFPDDSDGITSPIWAQTRGQTSSLTPSLTPIKHGGPGIAAWPAVSSKNTQSYGTIQAGSPSPAPATVGFVVFIPIPQVAPESCECVFVALQ